SLAPRPDPRAGSPGTRPGPRQQTAGAVRDFYHGLLASARVRAGAYANTSGSQACWKPPRSYRDAGVPANADPSGFGSGAADPVLSLPRPRPFSATSARFRRHRLAFGDIGPRREPGGSSHRSTAGYTH